MAETEYRRLLQLAQDKALFGYLAVVQRAMQDADRRLAELEMSVASGTERAVVTGIRHFLRQDTGTFMRSLEACYRSLLDRALQTMYVDLRADLRKTPLDELTLVDDETVNQQIEIGRLVQQIRDSNEASIGRLNLIIARLHGQSEARERENPFRPFILARALYDAVRKCMPEPVKGRRLYEVMAEAMLAHLDGFYDALRDVFESSGVHVSFVAQPSQGVAYQRYHGGPSASDGPGSGRFSHAPAPGLERIVAALAQAGAAMPDSATVLAPGLTAVALQEMIRGMVRPSRSLPISRPHDEASPQLGAGTRDNRLLRQLEVLQQRTLRANEGRGLDAGELQAQLDLEQATLSERLTVEVVGTLFSYMLEDERIPSALRVQMARLQAPLLKAAMLEPTLLHDENHPARRLLNRISSAGMGIDPESAEGRSLTGELEGITNEVLAGFDSDSRVFSSALARLENVLDEQLRAQDEDSARAVEAIEAAERYSVLLTQASRLLCDVLMPLNADKTLTDFIIAVWPHVLVRAAWRDRNEGGQLQAQYAAVLPDLVWSVQDKTDAQQRDVLIKLLPELVRRLRAAFDLVQVPEDDAQALLDYLVARHTSVLRTGAVPGASGGQGLAELRQAFLPVFIDWERATWGMSEPPQIREEAVEEAFAHFGVAADLRLLAEAPASAADREFLAQTYLLGTRVMWRSEGGERGARLVGVSTHRSLYLFRTEEGRLAVFSGAALLEGLGRGLVVPLEYAPVFERAVEALLAGE